MLSSKIFSVYKHTELYFQAQTVEETLAYYINITVHCPLYQTTDNLFVYANAFQSTLMVMQNNFIPEKCNTRPAPIKYFNTIAISNFPTSPHTCTHARESVHFGNYIIPYKVTQLYRLSQCCVLSHWDLGVTYTRNEGLFMIHCTDYINITQLFNINCQETIHSLQHSQHKYSYAVMSECSLDNNY